jgi:hypothetical protein
MKSRYITLVILFLVNISCNKEASPTTQKPTAAICNELLSGICSGNDNTGYCTFGYKWGKDNPFANAGAGKPGPGSGVTEISYKFQDAGLVFDTHSQRGVTSVSFDNMLNCSKQQVRNAFAAWEAVANVKFVEKSSEETADIKLIVANITQGGIAYPPIPNQTCGGLVILNSTSNYTCDYFYALVLHEIGHVLGLGHVTSNNAMKPGIFLRELRSGDIEGV